MGGGGPIFGVFLGGSLWGGSHFVSSFWGGGFHFGVLFGVDPIFRGCFLGLDPIWGHFQVLVGSFCGVPFFCGVPVGQIPFWGPF